tara:strand:- start:1232 stop:2020 length:789 start_codon:yes stop_codon:yes gene_type:complete
MDNLSDKNRQNASLLIAFFAGSIAALSTALFFLVFIISGSPWFGLIVAALTLASIAYISATSEQRALATLENQQMHSGQYPRLTNLVEAICLSTGIPVPEIRILSTEARNMAALGRSRAKSTLIVTTGLLSSASRIELEAVVANRISQIAAGQTALATTALSTFGLQIGIATIRVRPFALLPMRVKKRIGLALDPSDDFFNDGIGVALTRYPPGMVEALAMMENRNALAKADRITDSLWILSTRQNTDRPTAEARMTALREL